MLQSFPLNLSIFSLITLEMNSNDWVVNLNASSVSFAVMFQAYSDGIMIHPHA